MLTAIDIKYMAHSGEGYNVEFKESVPQKVRELAEEICAFANSAGGYLLIGINDKNDVVGEEIDNKKRSAMQDAVGNISPHIQVKIYPVEVDGKTVWVIDVPSGQRKPYLLSGNIFIREGANTQKQTDAEEVRASFQQANSIFFDEVPCRKFNPDHDLDTEFIRDFKSMAEFQRDMPNEHLFTNLKLYTDDGYFKNGAVLFFGQQPEDFLDNAFVRCVAYNDRVVITNPGGLISSIPPEKFGTMSRTRNPLIFGLFERIRLVEYIGSGVMRMRESMKEEQLPAPDFGLEGMFNITLIRPVSVEPEIDETNEELPKLSEIQTKVFDLIRNIVHCKVHCKVPK